LAFWRQRHRADHWRRAWMACLKSFPFITMPHHRLARKKGQPTADFVVAMLGNSPKMRHDVASWNILLAQPIMCACHFCWRCCVMRALRRMCLMQIFRRLRLALGLFRAGLWCQRNGFWRQKRCLRMQMNFMMIDHGRLSSGWQQNQPSQHLLGVTKT